ncbi:M17 family metallopeptidase [Nitrosovibrio tenuis]|uniref:Leucyl aminopeptidase n=1 Tax=Nitrosovibrio tenuis TaxID=1233 RepID=A0A1H7PV04_9PROT|nr:leucyl aminopeptidase family protein [Nitrosovibrio tenuis]SEL39711.1 leucyl aminopeptidase [Nitrosovibrio tenuis]
MLATLIQHASPLTMSTMAKHILAVLPKLDKLPDKLSDKPEVFGTGVLEAILMRREMQPGEISNTPIAGNLENGALCVWAMVDSSKSVFDQQTAMRKAVQLLLEESPAEIHLVVYGNSGEKHALVQLAIYTAWVNGALLPSRKTDRRGAEARPLAHIVLHGYDEPDSFALLKAKAEGNLLTRELTVLPPNELTPSLYRKRLSKLASSEGWKHTELDVNALRKIGAGAFIAVAQGSDTEDAAIVHLQRRVKNAAKTVALVGKGICFDTGGHNLKPARHMHGMNEDMNGSAVALGLLTAATRANIPVNIDCWLAIAQNLISPHAYKQNDVIPALNGTTIEIIHTDAEGRMVLADTLTLAAREKPDVMIDFATLTGSMHTALGSRYSGIFSNRDDLVQKALAAGKSSGERIWAFPSDADYDVELESKIADIKQCTLEGEADHILAARFLNRFVDDLPWLHMDLSASNNKGGLGAVGSDVTGFGVAWGIDMLAYLCGGSPADNSIASSKG